MLASPTVTMTLALSLILVASSPETQRDPPYESVAVVIELAGNVFVVRPSVEKKLPVRLFDWLPAGCIVEVGPRARIILAFCNGNRYELREGTEAELSESGPQAARGSARFLESVPPMPDFTSLASAPGARAGAIRIRGKQLARLYPHADATALPVATILSFSPIPGVTLYRVALEDTTGRTIFDAETQSTEVAIPSGVLAPGSRYFWSVTAVESAGSRVRGESEFVTLPAEIIRQRGALRASLGKREDVVSIALLAEVDRRLGLLMEARNQLLSALSKSKDDPAIRRLLELVEKQLASGLEPGEA